MFNLRLYIIFLTTVVIDQVGSVLQEEKSTTNHQQFELIDQTAG